MSLALGKRIDYNSVMRGLYVHIPFCKTRCHYCNFVSMANPSPECRLRFFKALEAEICHAREKFGRLTFDTLYLGGGTPSTLTLQEMNGVLEMLRGAFILKEKAEITCEWNPGDGDEGKLAAFAALGINRISLGVQSFQDVLLARLGRRHTTHDTLIALQKIRKAGLTNISFDLMLKIPGQTLADFQKSLERCLELQASQVSLYDLEVHEHTELGKLQAKGLLDLPGEAEHAAMYQSAIDILTGAGYEHYEISNFAKPGAASRHNLIYWHNQEYLGLGPGAFSYLNGIRSQFALDLDSYFKKCDAQKWKNDVEDQLSDEEKATETLVTGLRLRDGIISDAFPNMGQALRERIKALCDEKLLETEGGKLRLTDRGKFLSEDVFSFLLRH